MSTPEPANRILIVRLSAIGDVLHGLPVANALRDALPQAFLAWVVEGRTADLLRGHRALDELIALPRGWLKSPRTVLDLRRRLRALQFDMTIDLQGLSKSAIAARLSGARRRIGLGGKDGRELSRWLNNELVRPTRTHVTDRNLELLAPLGITHPAVRFDLDDSPVNASAARKILDSQRVLAPFAVINPGASWPSKRWPAKRFAAVARHLGQLRGLESLVVWAGDQERGWAEQIVTGSAGHAMIAPATSLGELAAIVRRAALFVGSDTGPLHLAAAVGTPCVGLFGPMPAERNGPYGPQHIAVQKILLTGTSRQRRTAGPESMEAISVDHVTEACDQILDRGNLGRRSA
ncbi:MAG: glycosyltransferase family 9 protein [Planctomycetia bacterium]|nr:glycosyltransferase family 9 protein [Planctomycetia bacterium]